MAKVPDILMVAEAASYQGKRPAFRTLFLTTEEFYQNEDLAKRYAEVLWQGFHTRGKYARIARHAEYFAVAVDARGHYLSSAFVVPVGAKWLLEYVITDPAKRGKGAGSAVLDRVMREAKKAKIQWVILNCNPKKNNGQLPALYAKFGFKKID